MKSTNIVTWVKVQNFQNPELLQIKSYNLKYAYTHITRKAAKLREFNVFSHCTPTVLHVVAEILHGKDSVFFQLIPKELEFDP